MAARNAVCPSQGRVMSVSGRKVRTKVAATGGRGATEEGGFGPQEAPMRREGVPLEAAGSLPLGR